MPGTNIYRSVLRYTDEDSGLGWTITNFYEAADPVAIQLKADLWHSAYMSLCPAEVKLVDIRISDKDLWGDATVFPGSFFTDPVGLAAGSMMPLAECALIVGRIDNFAQHKSSIWHVHGLASSFFNTDGSLKTGDAVVLALATASFDWLMCYRAEDTPVHGLPAITPPVQFGSFRLEGPYVRRLGNPFFLAGQRARYTRV
jgi:hypothetical protein